MAHRKRASKTVARATKKTFGSFQEMIDESDVPVMVESFYATWCGPCKLAAEMCGRLAGRVQRRQSKNRYGEVPGVSGEVESRRVADFRVVLQRQSLG